MIRRGEVRIVGFDGNYKGEGGELEAAALRRGRALLAEARALFHFNSRDRFSARRGCGTVLVSNVQRAAPLSPADEVLDAREELLRARAALLAGGPR